MAKEEKPKKTDEEEIFEEFGITDENEKKEVMLSAASRALAARKIKKLNGDQDEVKKHRLW